MRPWQLGNRWVRDSCVFSSLRDIKVSGIIGRRVACRNASSFQVNCHCMADELAIIEPCATRAMRLHALDPVHSQPVHRWALACLPVLTLSVRAGHSFDSPLQACESSFKCWRSEMLQKLIESEPKRSRCPGMSAIFRFNVSIVPRV